MMFCKLIARIGLPLVMAFTGQMASATPVFNLQLLGTSFYSESLRVGLDGKPFFAPAPQYLGGIYAIESNSHGVFAGTCPGSGYGASFKACTYSAIDGLKVIPFYSPPSTYSQAYATDAYDVNEKGDVLGGATNVNQGNTSIGLQIYTSEGNLLNLGIGTYRRPSLNSFFEVVGAGLYGGAFYYANGETSDLESLVSNLDGFKILQATDINDKGQIAGMGVDRFGNYQGFVLVSAVPEPESLALMLAGLTLIGGMARKRKST